MLIETRTNTNHTRNENRVVITRKTQNGRRIYRRFFGLNNDVVFMLNNSNNGIKINFIYSGVETFSDVTKIVIYKNPNAVLTISSTGIVLESNNE